MTAPTAEDLNRHAMRMSTLDEDGTYGLNYLYLHLSALGPTTRKSHADRHSRLFTAQEVRDFWADTENVAGCRCSVSAVMVDEHGKPLAPSIVKRARATYEKMKKRGYDWSK